MVRRVDGRPYTQYVREEIFEPIGMRDSWLGMTPETYRAYGDRIAPTYTLTGDGLVKAAMHGEAQCVPCFPAGNGRGPIRELGRFYEMLIDGGQRDGAHVLKAATVEEFTWPHRVGTFDKTFGHKMNWGLGFMVDSNQYGALTVPYGYGIHCSRHAFGHGGRECVAAFADPEHALVVAIAFNGMPGEPKHNKRNRDIATALYEDLGLVGRSAAV